MTIEISRPMDFTKTLIPFGFTNAVTFLMDKILSIFSSELKKNLKKCFH